MKSARSSAFAFFTVLLVAPVAAHATTWNVPGDMSGTCTTINPSCDTIQDAVTASANGDDIQVAAGTYPESNVHLNKTLTVAGAGAATTFVEPSGVGFVIDADGVVVRDLTIRNGTQAAAYTLIGSSIDDTEFNGVHFTNNTSRGIEISGAVVTNLSVVDCVFTSNNIGIRMSSTSDVNGLTVTGSTFTTHAQGIYQANENSTSKLSNLTVSQSTFTNDGFAIYAEEIRDSVIEDSTFTGNSRGVLLFKGYAASGVDVANVTIRNNTFSDSTAAAVQLVIQGTGLAGPIDVQGNTIDQNVGLMPANFGAIDIRLASALTHSPINVTDNSITLSGTFATATAAFGIALRGNGPVVITGNELDGGNVGGSGTTPRTSGIYLRSRDTLAAFSQIPATATFDASCNRIGGFENGVSVFDVVTATYGGLLAGTAVTFTDNSIVGDNQAGIVNGASPPTVDAEGNWWGCSAGPGNPGCDTVVGNVDAIPALTSPPACVSCLVNADCDDALACNGAETCNVGTGMCQAGTPVVCSDGNDCTTDTCNEPGGTCTFPPVADGAGCDDGVACSIPDTCQAGACESGGGPDLNGNDICDFDDIGELTVTQAKLKAQKPAGSDGKASGKGSFVTSPPADVFDASAPITIEVADGLTTDVEYTWSTAECQTKGTKILCRSLDKKTKALFKQVKGQPAAFAFKFKLANLAIDPPFGPPVTVTLSYDGPASVREGSIATCTAKPTSMKCKAP
jgi:hypothetical protein